MDSKQEARAIELRALAERVVKARGTWIDTNIPNRTVLVFENPNLQIVYREPVGIGDGDGATLNNFDFDRRGGTPLIEHYAVDIFLVPPGRKLTGTKVLTVFWKQGVTAIEVDSYVPGPWERWIEELASDLKQRVVQ